MTTNLPTTDAGASPTEPTSLDDLSTMGWVEIPESNITHPTPTSTSYITGTVEIDQGGTSKTLDVRTFRRGMGHCYYRLITLQKNSTVVHIIDARAEPLWPFSAKVYAQIDEHDSPSFEEAIPGGD